MSTAVAGHNRPASASGLAWSMACLRAAVLLTDVGSIGSIIRRQARVYDPITCSSERFDGHSYGWPVAVRRIRSAKARSTGTARGKRVERPEPANTQNPSQYRLSFKARLTCAFAANRAGGVAPAGWADARKTDSTSMNPIRKKPVSPVNRPPLQRARRTRKNMRSPGRASFSPNALGARSQLSPYVFVPNSGSK